MSAERPVVGYVLKMYPRFSETFVVTEILAREAAGEQIVIFSLRPPSDARFHPELARVQAPVVQIDRPASAHRWWASWQQTAADTDLAAGLHSALDLLCAADHDDAGQAVTLARLARAHGVTHLHAHFASVATTVARLAGLIARLPYSFTAHAKDIFHRDVERDDLVGKLTDAHHAITVSDYNLHHLQAWCGRESTRRLHRVYNGLELDRFTYEPRSIRRGGPARLLGVGRLVEKKGFDVLLATMSRLVAEGVDIELDIAGDGPLREELEIDIARRRLHRHVRLLGPRTQTEISELLGSHDVFVAPFVVASDGNVEGLPTVLLEAMARGIPCVASDITAVGEVVRPGETGWLVPSGDPVSLADTLMEVVENPSGHRSVTDKARALIEEHFDASSQALQLRRLLEGTGGADR